jgi:hypothetical protein
LSPAEEIKFLAELLFEDVLKGLRKHRFPDNNKDFGLTRLCDLHPHGTRTDGDLVLSVITPLADDYALYDEARCILNSSADGGALILRLDDDKTLAREVRTCIQTDKYVGRKNDGTASHTTQRILRERYEENRERRQRLLRQLEQLCREAACCAAGQPLQTKAGTAANAVADGLNSPSKWRRITVVKRKTVDSGKLQAARNLAKDVFGSIAPYGEDALDAHLREQLGRWRSDLSKYKTLADTGNYPGSQPIADALGVINKLLAQTESFELIAKFLDRRDDLLDLSDDVHELRNFYDHQRQTWDKLHQAEARF